MTGTHEIVQFFSHCIGHWLDIGHSIRLVVYADVELTTFQLNSNVSMHMLKLRQSTDGTRHLGRGKV